MQSQEDFILSIRGHVDNVLNSIVSKPVVESGCPKGWLTIPNTNKNIIVKGFKTNQYIAPGYVYAPYIPLYRQDANAMKVLEDSIIKALGIPTGYIIGNKTA